MLSSTREPAAGPLQPTTPGLMVAAELGTAVAAATSIQQLLATLQRQLKWLLPASHVAICLPLDDGQGYHLHTLDGVVTVTPSEGDMVGWVLREGKALDMHDLQQATSMPGLLAQAPGWNREGALLILPLVSENTVSGALMLGSPSPHAFTGVDRALVKLVSLQVAAALRTSLLIAELDGAEAILTGMARALEAKDAYTLGHAARVTAYAISLSEAAFPGHPVREIVAQAGPLHDIGKIGVPDEVLHKPGRLTEEEFALIKRHPVIGDEICRSLRSVRRALGGIRYHHERFDGRGYPDGLAGEVIPLEARILAIADTFDALTSDRPYRKGMPVGQALAIIQANEGPQWDPRLVPIFCNLHF